MKKLLLHIVTISASLTWIAAYAPAQVDPNRVVFTINGEDVKGSEYYRRMEFLPINGGNRSPGFLTISRLIEERMIQQAAKSDGSLPTAKEIEAMIEERKVIDPSFVDEWVKSGLTKEELNHQVLLELAEFKIQTKGITITDQEVEKFYKDKEKEFTNPERFILRVITVADDGVKDDKGLTSADVKKTMIDASLSAGRDFADVAKQYSEDGFRELGGSMGALTEEELGPKLLEAVRKTKIGKSTEWIVSDQTDSKGAKRNYKFFLENIMPKEVEPLDKNLREAIRRKLMYEKGGDRFERIMAETRAKVVVEVKQTQFKGAIENMVESFKTK